MKLLLLTTLDQHEYLQRFQKLGCLVGHDVKVMTSTPLTLSEIEMKCKKAGVEGIMLANEELLTKVLYATLDFRAPDARKQLTLNDYQGSLLSLKGIPCVVLNPPEQIMTVAYGAFIFSRFITKLTKPESWFKQTKFQWKLAEESTIEETYFRFKEARLLGVDIETPVPNPLFRVNCITFCAYFPDAHRTESIVIPFTSLYWLAWIRKFCDLETPKVLQGGTYDALYLIRFNCPLRNWFHDSLNLFHSYYSEFPKRLDFVAAYALREIRFWKDDGKSGSQEDYYRYNAMDGWATVNAYLSLLSEVPDWALRNYKEEFPLNYPCLHCELEGWRVDPEAFKVAQSKQAQTTETKLKSLRTMLKAPHYNPGSWQQNQKVWTILGCGDIEKTGEIYMKKVEFRHPLNAVVIGAIRSYKKADKLESNYFDVGKIHRYTIQGQIVSRSLSAKDTPVSFEGNPVQWRLFYRLQPAGTDTGRLASSESSFWTGYQIQNIPRGPEVKQYLLADSGWELAEPDFEQSEARCVFYLAGEQKGIDLVESDKDYHCWNVQAFFGIKYEVTWDFQKKKVKPEHKDTRELSKRTNHGANYNMTEGVMLDTMGPKNVARAKQLLIPNYEPARGNWLKLSLKEVCKFLLTKYAETYPGVKGRWYESILKQIEFTKKLVSPLGHTRHFFGDPRNNKHHLNAAVAHGPQNLSVSIINRCFYKIWRESVYGELRNHVRIKAQIHDSIPFQYRKDSAWATAKVAELMRYPVEITGSDGKKRTMVIPVGMKSGKERWSEL